jgi:2,3-bisphosphoglycerate-independent phosphoglycerate mutase
MGNSEVGHLNLGAGRIVYQDLTRINQSIRKGQFASIPALVESFERARTGGRRLHLWGLVSDGGVHSHQEHLLALVDAASDAGVPEIFVHAVTDGRDTSPTGAREYLAAVRKNVEQRGAKIATVIGRYYAMDRDHRWERTKLAWDAIVLGRGSVADVPPEEAVAKCYHDGKTDEFLPALIFSHANEQRVRDGDVVLCFNFRSDRARQLTQAFLLPEFAGFEREVTPRVHYVTLTEYDKTYTCPVAYPPQTLNNILGEVVSNAGLSQLRIAETEKYPHVTYFFNGGVEVAFPGEERMIIPSPKVATYDLQPEMSAPKVTHTVLEQLGNFDLVILNYANGDMVGHTGVVRAGIKAVETVDDAVRRVVEKTLELGGKCLVTADHGNCEYMRNKDGTPNTAHTNFLVHFLYVAEDAARYRCQDGILADVAPTLLTLLGLEPPPEMTGKCLVLPQQ